MHVLCVSNKPTFSFLLLPNTSPGSTRPLFRASQHHSHTHVCVCARTICFAVLSAGAPNGPPLKFVFLLNTSPGSTRSWSCADDILIPCLCVLGGFLSLFMHLVSDHHVPVGFNPNMCSYMDHESIGEPLQQQPPHCVQRPPTHTHKCHTLTPFSHGHRCRLCLLACLES